MPTPVFIAVMAGALCHAGWNTLIKGAGDTTLCTILVAGLSALIGALALPWLAPPAPASWPFLLTSALLQALYFVLLARIYRVADMSLGYPLMRGCAPLVVALTSVVWLGDTLSALAWTGIAVLCTGILTLAGNGHRAAAGRGLWLAPVNALVIAAYTLIDGIGVRHSAAPIAYTLWLFLLTGIPLCLWAVAGRRLRWRHADWRVWRAGLIGAVGSLLSYGLALWAMTRAPVALVAALRECAIVFGVALSVLVLKEPVGRVRMLAVGVIAAGAMLLRLA